MVHFCLGSWTCWGWFLELRGWPLCYSCYCLSPSSSSGFHQLEPRCTSAAALKNFIPPHHMITSEKVCYNRQKLLTKNFSRNFWSLLCVKIYGEMSSLTPVRIAVSIHPWGISVWSPAKCILPSGKARFSWYSSVWNIVLIQKHVTRMIPFKGILRSMQEQRSPVNHSAVLSSKNEMN